MLVLRSCAMVMLLATVLGACGSGGDLRPLPADPVGIYRLGPGDQVRIITVGEDSLTGEFRVDDSGTIAVPMLGSVRAAGLSPAELGNAVDASLRRKGLLRAPSVSVEVIRYRPIFVLGEVNKPGEFDYQPGMTVLGAVALAGGFTDRAVQRSADVVRTDNDRAREGRANRYTRLQPGDVVTIPERRF